MHLDSSEPVCYITTGNKILIYIWNFKKKKKKERNLLKLIQTSHDEKQKEKTFIVIVRNSYFPLFIKEHKK